MPTPSAHTPSSRSRAPAPGLKKTSPARAPAKKSSVVNHKSAEAQKKREDLDAKVSELLKQNPSGMTRAELAKAAKADGSAVKASLNRLHGKKLVRSTGSTIDKTYFHVEPKSKKTSPAPKPSPRTTLGGSNKKNVRGKDEEDE